MLNLTFVIYFSALRGEQNFKLNNLIYKTIHIFMFKKNKTLVFLGLIHYLNQRYKNLGIEEFDKHMVCME